MVNYLVYQSIRVSIITVSIRVSINRLFRKNQAKEVIFTCAKK